MQNLKALEFFSGIGAFAEAARFAGVEVVAAFDQSAEANLVYQANFGMAPVARNLDSICQENIPKADLWWASPPCTPYSRRGRQKDIDDTRANSFLRFMALVPQFLPAHIIVENVIGFASSKARARLLEVLNKEGYEVLELALCSSQLGAPMRRPRHFVLASRLPFAEVDVPLRTPAPLSSFLVDGRGEELQLALPELLRYGGSLNIVQADANPTLICFTSGYGKCLKAAGSFLRTEDGKVRRFHPSEILRLFGFADHYRFPQEMPLKCQWRLLGNSCDVRAIKHLLLHLIRRH